MSQPNPWVFGRFPEYYDVDSGAVARHSQELAQLSGKRRSQALDQIRDGVLRHADGWDDALLPRVAVSLTDDLYKFGCTAEYWDEATEAYVAAVWGSFFPYLAQRGFQIRYVAENTWPDGLERPLQLFPDLFAAAGVAYVCPHSLAWALPDADGSDGSIASLAGVIGEGRLLAGATVRTLNDVRAHFLYLEADYEEGSLDAVLGLATQPGTVDILRTEPAVSGSRIEVRVTPVV